MRATFSKHLLTPILVCATLCGGVLPGHCEPNFQDPDMAALLKRVAPHFKEGAGSPVPGMVRGFDPYKEKGFYVAKPEMVMPTGAGLFSAMVSYGDRLELHLSHTGYFNAMADNKSGLDPKVAHYNNLLSPGHVSLELANATAKDITKFDQWIDFSSGSVVIELGTSDGDIRIEVAGDMNRDNIVISIKDARRTSHEASIRYENWRDTMVVKDVEGKLLGAEAVDVSEAKGWKAQSMSFALQIGCVNGASFKTATDKNSGSITIPKERAADFNVVISGKSAHGLPPAEMAASSWNETAGTLPAQLEKERLDWWKNFWSHSWIEIAGPNADYLSRLWYTTLYSYACVGQGAVPPKFNGGPGLVFYDTRSWGDGYWWQNQREISFWPMATAGHPEFTRKAILFFNHAYESSQRHALRFKFGGVLFSEGNSPRDWSTPFGKYPLVENPVEKFDLNQINPIEALKHREGNRAGFNGNQFSSGLEFVQAIFDYIQFEGDKEVLQKIAAPWLKGEALMCMSLLTLEEDGKYHVQSADSIEEWWKVKDPAPLLAGIHYIFEMTVRYGKSLGFEEAFIEAVKERQDKLVPLPTVAAWSYKPNKNGNFFGDSALTGITPGDTLLAPFAVTEGVVNRNAENPELYAVFPFALVDLNSDAINLERGRATFKHRFLINTCGWSQCAVQAARLGLPEAMDVMLEHATKFQRYPYGGWNSPAGSLYKGGPVVDCPFFDAAGVNMTALQESLIQSHAPGKDSPLFESGLIRLLPAVSEKWSGRFLLHARGGFSVTVQFAQGKVEAARFVASRDAKLRLLNPFENASVWVDGKLTTHSEKIISVDVKNGGQVIISK